MSKYIATEPHQIAECVSAYLGEGDLEGIATLFHPECQIFFQPDSPPSMGISGVRSAFEAFIDLYARVESKVFSEVIAGDIALIRANWEIVTADDTVLAKGQSTEVAKRFNHGGWGYLIDCPNGVPKLLTI